MKDRRILIVKTGEALAPVKERCGDFEDWIARGMGCRLDSIDVTSVYAGERLPSPDALGGVVITGSPAMVTDQPEWSERAAQWLAKLIRADAMPILGLCYGHQLMAHSLGGEVGANPQGREMGTVDVTFHETSGRKDLGDAKPTLTPLFELGVFGGHMSHVESVLRPPKEAIVLARTALEPNAVLAFGPRQWGVQFHPEFDREIMQGYVEARREILVGESLDPDAMIREAAETPGLTRVLARFLALVQKG